MTQRHTRPPLGPGLWLFIVTRIVGIILNAAFVAFVTVIGVRVLPAVVGVEDVGGYAGDVFGEVVLLVAEIVATIIGLVLIFRRAPSVRKFWLVYLSLNCLVQFWQAFGSLESGGARFFLVMGLAWLAYWVGAPRPRRLPLEGFWAHPDAADQQGQPRGDSARVLE